MTLSEKIALQAVDYLREQGFTVVLWTPEEVGEADSKHLESLVIERGNDYLGMASA